VADVWPLAPVCVVVSADVVCGVVVRVSSALRSKSAVKVNNEKSERTKSGQVRGTCVHSKA
jgi:hypothetical protein